MLAIVISPLLIQTASAESIDMQSKEPKLFIENSDLPEVTIGDEFDLNLVINNDSIYTAKEIKITPVLDGGVFESCEFMTTKDLTNIVANKSGTVDFKFKVSPSAKPGVYPLQFNFRYRNMYKVYYGQNGDRSRTIYLKVVDTPGLPEVDIDSMIVEPEKVKAGRFVDIKLNLLNSGVQEAKDIELTLGGLSAEGFSIYNDLNSRMIETLSGGESTSFTYQLKADDDMKTGGHKLSYVIEFKDKFDREYKREADLYIAVLAKDDEDEEDDSNTIPKVIVSEYSTNPQVVDAGSNFDLSLTFFNTSKIKTVRNIKISLGVNERSTTSGNIFAPINSSNTLYIDELEPEGSAFRTMPFHAVNDAQPKTYNVVVTFEYEDKQGKEYEATEEIGIRVIQKPRLEANEPKIPETSLVGEYIPLEIEFYNMGRTTIYNLLVSVESENLDIDTPSKYVGNFDSGRSEYFDTGITPIEEGQASGVILYKFEDSAGESMEVRQEFVLSAEPRPDPGVNPNENPGGGINNPIMDPTKPQPGMEEPEIEKPLFQRPITWVGIVALLALVIWLLYRRKRKNNAIEDALIKELTLNE